MIRETFLFWGALINVIIISTWTGGRPVCTGNLAMVFAIVSILKG
jgi:hypothetical protein